MTDAVSSAPDARLRLFDDELVRLTLDGWTVDFRTADQAALSRPRVGPFWLHLILLIVTAGVWFFVAVTLRLYASPERTRVWIDAEGRILQREARADLHDRAVSPAA